MPGRWVMCVIVAVAALPGCAAYEGDRRPVGWAQPVRLATVRRLYRVDQGLYRSAKLSDQGWQDLQQWGVRTAVCLELRRREVPESIEQIHVGIDPLHPVHRQFVQFLRAAAGVVVGGEKVRRQKCPQFG